MKSCDTVPVKSMRLPIEDVLSYLKKFFSTISRFHIYNSVAKPEPQGAIAGAIMQFQPSSYLSGIRTVLPGSEIFPGHLN
jgi:hypothetical protein